MSGRRRTYTITSESCRRDTRRRNVGERWRPCSISLAASVLSGRSRGIGAVRVQAARRGGRMDQGKQAGDRDRQHAHGPSPRVIASAGAGCRVAMGYALIDGADRRWLAPSAWCRADRAGALMRLVTAGVVRSRASSFSHAFAGIRHNGPSHGLSLQLFCEVGTRSRIGRLAGRMRGPRRPGRIADMRRLIVLLRGGVGRRMRWWGIARKRDSRKRSR